MDQRLVDAQAKSWKVAIVRGSMARARTTWSVAELIVEYACVHGTMVTVGHADGTTEAMTEVRLRLACEQVG
jgi:hypothetical protein